MRRGAYLARVSGAAGNEQGDRVANAGMVMFLLKGDVGQGCWQGKGMRRMQG